MRIPLTKFGWPQVVLIPTTLLALMVVYLLMGMLFLPVWIIAIGEAVLAAVLVLVVSFFRDPHRLPPVDTSVLLAPADGQITDIEVIGEDDYIGSKALRIGIFMSIFNVHINRAPGNARVEKITHKPGRYIVANNARAGRVNESNDLALVRTDEPKDKLVVRQISGAVARRIVCTAKEGQELTGGEKFGMIKFGSRAELIIGVRDNVKCLVQVGDKVKAGLTPLLRYE